MKSIPWKKQQCHLPSTNYLGHNTLASAMFTLIDRKLFKLKSDLSMQTKKQTSKEWSIRKITEEECLSLFPTGRPTYWRKKRKRHRERISKGVKHSVFLSVFSLYASTVEVSKLNSDLAHLPVYLGKKAVRNKAQRFEGWAWHGGIREHEG